VRNNQRRSRARRREYVAELERKVQECNARGLQSCIPDVVPQDNIVQLKEENRKLRELLNLVGVEQALIDTHLVAEGGVPKAADASINWLQSSSETAQENLVSLRMVIYLFGLRANVSKADTHGANRQRSKRAR
jgi:hypothetical protein